MSRKHEVNIKKSNLINIQLLIIAILSFSYFMYEVSIYSEPSTNIAEKVYTPEDNSKDPDEIYDGVEVYVEPVIETKTIKQQTSLDVPVEIVKNDTPEIETTIETKPEVTEQPKLVEGKTSETIKKTPSFTKKGVSKTKKKVLYSTKTVDFLPVFPGCDKYSTNAERAVCFEKKVTRLILRKYNSRIGEELGLKGRQRIMLYFEINQNGEVSNIRASSKAKIFDLEKEAIRVAKKLPIMEPARAGNEKVKMAYSVPIVFDAQ